MLALCCSYFASAQCPTTLTDTVTGNNIAVNVPNWTVSGFDFAWYLDGNLVQAANPNTRYVYQNVPAGTHRICMYSYDNNTHFCDSVCETVNVPSCGTASFASYILNDSTIRGYSTSTGTNDSSVYVWYVYNSSGTVLQSSSTGHTSAFLSNPLPTGTYRVCLYLYNNTQLLCSYACDTIQVLRCSSLNAGWQVGASSSSDTARFYASSGNPTGTVYAWTFGDGSTSSLPTVTHVYSQAGTYTACLIVSNPALTCKDTVCQTVTVGNASACGTAALSVYVLNDSLIRGYSTSTGTTNTSDYVWNVYNANGGLVQSYNTGTTNNLLTGGMPIGSYRVCLDLYNGQVLCDSACTTVNIFRCSSFNPQWTYTSSTANDTLKVVGPTNNPAGTTYAWTFGDGSSSTVPGLTHVYSQSGVYTVCLVLSNPSLTCRDTLCQSVTIGNPNACGTASFLGYVYNDSIIHAYSNSTGTSDSSSYVWNVYNANNVLVQTSSTGHTNSFLSNNLPAGTYKLCLDLYNAQHQFCDSFCNTIQVLRCSSLNAQWSYTSSTANDTLRVNAPTNNPTGTTYAWTFGDGGTSSYPSVTHVYSQSGAHTVCLIVSNPALTCHDTLCQSITVGGAGCSGLSAVWTYTGANTTGTPLQFTGPGNNPSGTSYVWNFGDGTSSTSANPTHVYANAGNYTICLVAASTAGCLDTSCGHITITSPTPCGVAAVGAYVVGDTSIHAYSNSTGVDTNTIYNWIIRNSSGAIVATHDGRNYYFFATGGLPNGSYSVCVYLYNSNQQFCDSACTVATLSGCPGITAQWSYTISHDTVTFVSADTNSHASHYWNFGDGTSGTGTHVTHVYPNYGTIRVCFYDYLSGRSCADSLCETITIPSSNTCGTASFQDYIYGDTSIHAYSNSTGTNSATIYGWVIKGANGNIIQTQTGTSNFLASQHLSPGAYIVCLSLYNGTTFCDSICNNVVVPIIGACGTAAFGDTVYPGIGGGAIHAFTTATNVDSLSQISWKIWGANGNLVQVFTGGAFTSSTLDSGTYVVCQYIRATNSTRICDSICQSVVVGGGNNPCAGLSAAWTYNLQSNSTDSMEFHGANDPTGTYYRWTFGDGGYNYGQNITHGYAQSGTYDVCLVVFNSSNTCRDTVCRNITITTTTPCPVASFSQYVYQDSIIHAFSNSTGTTASTVYEWVVTNANGVIVQSETAQGTTSSLLSHALPNGTYTVCLYVNANPNTYCDSVCQSITIANTINPCSGLNANFTTTHLNNGNVQFIPTDTASGVSHYWHFGDGTVSTNNDPTHAYSTPGLYHVCQYVYYAGNTTCIDSFCTNVQASASGCSAGFTYQGYYPPYNGVHFTNTSTSTDSIIAYRWTFGDSTTASFASGDHVFPHSGRWYVCLLIYASNGCTSTYCDSITVNYDPCYGLSANYTYTYTQSGGVHFAGSTTNTTVSNLWTFGDGTTATTFDPTHYYTQAGAYTVCHIVTMSGTLCSDTSCQTVQGTGTGTSCHANFTDSIVANSTSVIFTNTSTSSDSIVSYVWNFGDGSSSTSANTHHTYTASGSVFNVCLTITSANGCTNTYCDSVHIGHYTTACHASFNYTIDSCQVVTFTSTSTGDLSFLRWVYGDGTTDTLSHPTHVYAQGGYYTVVLHFYGLNCYNFDTVVIYVPSCTSAGDTVCGVVFNDLNGNGVQNTGEAGIPYAEIHVGSYVTHADSNGHYVIVVPAGTYSIYYCAPTGYTFTIPVHTPLNTNSNCSAYQNIVISSGSNCGYNFGIQNNSVTICGTVYFDANNNQVQNQGESGLANAQVVFSDEGSVVYTVYTDQYGHYCAVLPVDTYVISVHSTSYTNGVITPGSITVNANTGGGSYDNNNFGVYVQPGTCDLSINVSPNSNVTPGYPAWYQIEVCNVGTNVSSGTVNLFYDPSLRYNYSSPAATSQNSTTYTASWALNNLNPGTCQYYYVSLTADSNLVTGQFIFTLATVNLTGCQDVNQANNVDTVHQNVTASWDPNNKQVSPLGEGPQGLVHGDQWLTYTISFQNTGTAPAVNIVVLDTLSQYLDVSTFKMIGSNLPYTLQFNGNEAIWKFNAVSQPDSATDQQGSHGFVTFMILPLPNLPSKTPITNQADIFFDYNAGVSTNKTLNTIDYTLSVSNVALTDVTITLQPNPFNQYTTIKVDGAEGPYQLNVYDMLGRVVKNHTASGNIFNVDRGTMAAGVYMYEVTHNGTVIGKGKMVAQ